MRGTKNVLDLAIRFSRLERLFQMSTAHVCGTIQGRVYEDDLVSPLRSHNFYEECKCAAERLVREATGLPLTVFRPSMVVGDSRDQKIEKVCGPYRLIGALDRGWLKLYPGPCLAPFHRPGVVKALSALGRYPYVPEKAFTYGELRSRLEEAGFESVERTGILFVPGVLRMLDLFLWLRWPGLTRVTSILLAPFEQLEEASPRLARHGYLVACVARKPEVG